MAALHLKEREIILVANIDKPGYLHTYLKFSIFSKKKKKLWRWLHGAYIRHRIEWQELSSKCMLDEGHLLSR